MSTSLNLPLFCICSTAFPHCMTSNISFEKQLTREQLISYKKKLNLNTQNQLSRRDKLSISEFKKCKQQNKQDKNKLTTTQQHLYQNKNSNHILAMNDNYWRYNQTPNMRKIQGHNTFQIQYFDQRNNLQPQKNYNLNQISYKKANYVQNKQYQLPNSSQLKRKVLVPQLNLKQIKQNIYQTSIQTEKYQKYNYQKRIISCGSQDSIQSIQRLKSAHQTISTSISKQNIYIKQAQSLNDQPQNLLLPKSLIPQNQIDFSQGFRKAQSLQDNDSESSELSIVLKDANQIIKQAQTQRKHYIRDTTLTKLNQTQRRSNNHDYFYNRS